MDAKTAHGRNASRGGRRAMHNASCILVPSHRMPRGVGGSATGKGLAFPRPASQPPSFPRWLRKQKLGGGHGRPRPQAGSPLPPQQANSLTRAVHVHPGHRVVSPTDRLADHVASSRPPSRAAPVPARATRTERSQLLPGRCRSPRQARTRASVGRPSRPRTQHFTRRPAVSVVVALLLTTADRCAVCRVCRHAPVHVDGGRQRGGVENRRRSTLCLWRRKWWCHLSEIRN